MWYYSALLWFNNGIIYLTYFEAFLFAYFGGMCWSCIEALLLARMSEVMHFVWWMPICLLSYVFTSSNLCYNFSTQHDKKRDKGLKSNDIIRCKFLIGESTVRVASEQACTNFRDQIFGNQLQTRLESVRYLKRMVSSWIQKRSEHFGEWITRRRPFKANNSMPPQIPGGKNVSVSRITLTSLPVFCLYSATAFGNNCWIKDWSTWRERMIVFGSMIW